VSGYLDYPLRGLGYDHDRYDWQLLPERGPVEWPGGSPVALFCVVVLEWFRFDAAAKPFRAMAAPAKEYPDYREWTLRDYGTRVGLFRLAEVLGRHDVRVTAAIDAATCEHRPAVVEEALARGWEVIGHGRSAGEILHAGIEEEAEREIVASSLATVRAATGQPVRGWLSPSGSESRRTPDVLAANGIDYLCDWVNDDLPYRFRTEAGALWSLPASYELSDVNVLLQLHQTAPDYAAQVVDACAALEREPGRMLGLTLNPWLVGQPHRIGHLDRALGAVSERCWRATGSEILAAWEGSGA
jgi:allantoinase